MSRASRRTLLLAFGLTMTLVSGLDARTPRTRVEPFQMSVPELPYPEFGAASGAQYSLAGVRPGMPAQGESVSFDVALELEPGASAVDRPPVARLPVAAFVRYPTSRLWSAATGEVVVRAAIDEAGNVESVQLLRASDPQFGAAVLKGLPRYRFSPATAGGVPVAFRGTYKVRFVLPDQTKPSA